MTSMLPFCRDRFGKHVTRPQRGTAIVTIWLHSLSFTPKGIPDPVSSACLPPPAPAPTPRPSVSGFAYPRHFIYVGSWSVGPLLPGVSHCP